MSEQMNIEQLVRSKLEGQEITPSAGTWRSIRRRVRWKQFMRFDPGKFNIFYAAGILVIGAGLITLTQIDPGTDRRQDQQPRQESMQQESTATERQNREVIPGDTGATGEPAGEEIPATGTGDIADENAPSREMKEEPSGGRETTPEQEASSGRTGDQQSTVRQEAASQEEGSGKTPVHGTLIAYFTSSVSSGCAPLTVQFFNQSANHSSTSWSMGAGTPVTGENPVHTFTEPGRHHVTMTVMGEGGQTAAFSQVVEVYPVPRADFIIEEGIRGTEGPEMFDLINCSVGGTSYRWQMLGENKAEIPGWSSDQFQPTLPVSEIERENGYIRLVATNEHGCSHSVVREVPELPSSAAPELRFPTAFSPNPAGPTGGYYSPHEKRNDVFYPVFGSEPLEYRLRIYSRRGEMVFETNDIYQGWDGYYQQELSAAGVYVWMAAGTWQNGDEFRMQGDVTLVRTDQR